MKNTIVMLSFIVTLIAVWLFLGLLIWTFSDMSYKESATQDGLGFFMLFLGWIPALVVGCDVNDYLNH